MQSEGWQIVPPKRRVFQGTFGAHESPLVREVRGMGLLLGVELKQKVTPYLAALMERGVLALPAGANVLRLLPPLVITRDEVDAAADAIEEVLGTPRVDGETPA
jgi:acetylornithine/LysW-gamma-L-lysine aminotransferase